jgi:nicotinate dehydrogenase subunit A
MKSAWKLKVNGVEHTLHADGETPLLYLLRNDLHLKGPRFGCGEGICGACSVLADGAPLRSCVMPVAAIGTMAITTLEHLGGPHQLHPVQKAFIAEQAAQCGYCINGMLIAAAALLARNPSPTREDIVAALDAHLCRCGTHLRILRAVERAARELQGT